MATWIGVHAAGAESEACHTPVIRQGLGGGGFWGGNTQLNQ